MQIQAVGRALPPNYYEQSTLLQALKKVWPGSEKSRSRLDRMHEAVQVSGRHLALPIDEYHRLSTFRAKNDAYIEAATELAETALYDALGQTGAAPEDIDHIFFTTVTGIAVPSIDARMANRIGFRADVKRTPIFGLGCVAGAAGIARVADYLKAYPDQLAVLVAVELCSLTLQPTDESVANMIASALFGDGAAAVVMAGSQREQSGPRVIASRSVLFPRTEEVMGWEVGDDGFRIVLNAGVPNLVREHIRPNVDSFLAERGLSLGDVDHFVFHSGGPKVLESFEEALELPTNALDLTWKSLDRLGNLSSVSVLMVLRDTIDQTRPAPGSYGLLLAMGPGFCAEMVLLQW
jgi:alkylresorcinol/alkylpyrone synthase